MRFFLLSILFSGEIVALAQLKPVPLDESVREIDLSTYIEILEDPTGKLSLEDVQSDPR